AGRSLAEALEACDGQFPPAFASVVRAAEASGTLPEALERLAETREREQKLRSKLTSALLYPSLLILTAVAALVTIMAFVVPRFKAMFLDSGVQVPPTTAAIIEISDWLAAYWPVLAGGVAVL